MEKKVSDYLDPRFLYHAKSTPKSDTHRDCHSADERSQENNEVARASPDNHIVLR
jgi:hypothetical protein